MTSIWIKAAAVRAVKTMAQAAIAIIGTEAILSDIDWRTVVSAAVVAGVLSILTSLKGLPEADTDAEEYTRDDDDTRRDG